MWGPTCPGVRSLSRIPVALDTSCLLRSTCGRRHDVVSCIAALGQPSEEALRHRRGEREGQKLGAVAAYDVDIRDEFAETSSPRPSLPMACTRTSTRCFQRPVAPGHLPPPREGCPGRGAVLSPTAAPAKATTRCALSSSARPSAPPSNHGPVRSWGLRPAPAGSSMPSRAASPWTPPGNPYSIGGTWEPCHRKCSVLGDPGTRPPRAPGPSPLTPRAPRTGRPTAWSWASGGLPVSIDGQRMKLYDLIAALNKIVSSHGFGRITSMMRTSSWASRAASAMNGRAPWPSSWPHKQLECLCLPGDVLHTSCSSRARLEPPGLQRPVVLAAQGRPRRVLFDTRRL